MIAIWKFCVAAETPFAPRAMSEIPDLVSTAPGTPVICPVSALRPRPLGRLPDPRVHRTGAVRPEDAADPE